MRPARLISTVAFLAVLAMAIGAQAQQTYWETEELLVDFFPDADRITYFRGDLATTDLDVLERRLGYRAERSTWTVFVALVGDEVAGYAVIDEEQGQHEPITFAVRLSPESVIDRVEVVVYREHYGDEIRDRRFRAQFVGRDWHDDLRLGRDIVAVSGATISSRSLAVGARRVSAIVALFCERWGVRLGVG